MNDMWKLKKMMEDIFTEENNTIDFSSNSNLNKKDSKINSNI